MIDVVSPAADRFDRSDIMIEFFVPDEPGGVPFEILRGDGAAPRTAIMSSAASHRAAEPHRRSPRRQARRPPAELRTVPRSLPPGRRPRQAPRRLSPGR